MAAVAPCDARHRHDVHVTAPAILRKFPGVLNVPSFSPSRLTPWKPGSDSISYQTETLEGNLIHKPW